MLHSMASLSVLNYNLPPGLTMKLNNANTNSSNMSNSSSSPARGLMSKTFNKITVQNVLSENNSNALNIAQGNPNAIVRKIKDFGMIGTVNSAGAKSMNINCNPRKRPLSENTKSSPVTKEKKAAVSVAKKPKLSKEERTALRLAKKAAKENSSLAVNVLSNAVVAVKLPGTPGRKGLPLPQAVARRNARERNRVKQVNNGFAALRERIPEEVAEAFEAHSSCKNNGKKLSKVETLRMAVEYIRSLERLLGFDFPMTSGKGFHSTSSSGEESFSMIKDEFDAFSPSMDEHFDDSLSHYDNEDYFAQQSSPVPAAAAAPINSGLPQLDALPNITTLNGLQYIRIPGTNTYQLLTPDIFVGTAASPPSSTVDEEHFNALIDANCVSPTSMSSPIPAATAATSSLSTSLAHATTADLNSSPPAIRASTMAMSSSPVSRTANAPVSTNTKCAKTMEGSESLLSTCSSPVPQLPQQQHQHSQQMISPMLTSSPSTTSTGHNNNNNNNNDPTTAPTLQATTPAVNKRHHHHHHDHRQQQQQMEGLRQTCAVNNHQQQQQQLQQLQRQQHILENYVIKQEFEEPSIIYHHQQTSPVQQQHQLYMPPHNTMAMSPPLERQTPTTSNASSAHLQQFFNTNGSAVFFDGVVNLKKEFTEDLLDGPHTSNVLSDESMIESIDWWEAHTPKSDGGSVMM